MLNCDCSIQYLKPLNCVQKKKKKWAQACLKMLSTKCIYKSYIFDIYIYKQDSVLIWIYALIHLAPEGVVSDVLLGSLESFGSSSIILPSPCRPYQRWTLSDIPYRTQHRKEKKMEIELAFYLFERLLIAHQRIWLACLKLLSTKSIYKSYIFDIYV